MCGFSGPRPHEWPNPSSAAESGRLGPDFHTSARRLRAGETGSVSMGLRPVRPRSLARCRAAPTTLRAVSTSLRAQSRARRREARSRRRDVTDRPPHRYWVHASGAKPPRLDNLAITSACGAPIPRASRRERALPVRGSGDAASGRYRRSGTHAAADRAPPRARRCALVPERRHARRVVLGEERSRAARRRHPHAATHAGAHPRGAGVLARGGGRAHVRRRAPLGRNTEGQLGDGTRIDRDRPVVSSAILNGVPIEPGNGERWLLTATGSCLVQPQEAGYWERCSGPDVFPHPKCAPGTPCTEWFTGGATRGDNPASPAWATAATRRDPSAAPTTTIGSRPITPPSDAPWLDPSLATLSQFALDEARVRRPGRRSHRVLG